MRSQIRRRKKERMKSGLPDGIFSNQISKFGKISECLEMKVVGKFSGRLAYLLLFGIFYGHLVYFVVILVHFSSIGMLYRWQSWMKWGLAES
jgi:hypothetical protein